MSIVIFKNSHYKIENHYNKNKVWLQTWMQFKTITSLNIFLLDVNFDKFIIKLHYLLISSMLENSRKQKTIVMKFKYVWSSSIFIETIVMNTIPFYQEWQENLVLVSYFIYYTISL